MRYNGLIIPRSYNDYFSRSDPQAIRELVGSYTDEQLNETSALPIQNKTIAKLIPATASETNKLADKAFVNSTVGTNTAIFRGTFNSLAELEAYAGEKTNNDYAFVIDTDSAGNTEYNRYKYDGNSWEYEYTLNNSSFTAEQWAAIESGITAEKVARYDAAASIIQTFNAVHPIGEVYVQYPNFLDPMTLYNKNGISSVWEEINYAGAFFRASGGNAQSFDNQESKQNESLKSHNHTFTGSAVNTGGMSKNSTGYITTSGSPVSTLVGGNFTVKTGYTGDHSRVEQGGHTGNYAAYIDVSHTHSVTAAGTISDTGGAETRPENYTIKIWKRTA